MAVSIPGFSGGDILGAMQETRRQEVQEVSILSMDCPRQQQLLAEPCIWWCGSDSSMTKVSELLVCSEMLDQLRKALQTLFGPVDCWVKGSKGNDQALNVQDRRKHR